MVNNGRKEFIYKNVFEGVSPEESQGLRKNWITREAKRKSERAKEIDEKKQKRANKIAAKQKSKKVGGKRKSKNVGGSRKSRKVGGKQESMRDEGLEKLYRSVPGASSKSVSPKAAHIQVEEQKAPEVRKLVGGQLLFHNRKVRTFSLMDRLRENQ